MVESFPCPGFGDGNFYDQREGKVTGLVAEGRGQVIAFTRVD